MFLVVRGAGTSLYVKECGDAFGSIEKLFRRLDFCTIIRFVSLVVCRLERLMERLSLVNWCSLPHG